MELRLPAFGGRRDGASPSCGGIDVALEHDDRCLRPLTAHDRTERPALGGFVKLSQMRPDSEVVGRRLPNRAC